MTSSFADQQHGPGAPHPALAAALRVKDEVKGVLDLDPTFMATADKEAALVAWTDLVALVEAQRLRLMAAAADVAADHGHRDAAVWLAQELRLDRSQARRDQKLAVALSDRWHVLAAALAKVRVNLAQARVIAHALDELPDDLDKEVLAKAEAYLIDQADTFGPKTLRRLGLKVLEVIAPDVAEDHERKRIEADEQRARTQTRLTTQRLGDGTSIVRARISDAALDRLLTYLHAYTSPLHQRAVAAKANEGASKEAHTEPDPAPYPVRLGRAFEAFLEGADSKRLPLHGGNATSVVVLIDEAKLRELTGTAITTSGELLSTGQVRRLACTSGILPAVLGGKSEILDVGRRRRLFTYAQRVALAIRDKHCRARGCDVPAAMCEAHHLDPWRRGGLTDLARGLLLCSFHHHRVHDAGYRHELTDAREVAFTRRT